MFAAAKFVHLVSLGLVALAIANAFLGPHAARAAAPVRNELFAVIALFGRLGRIGLLLLWLTGAWMLFDRYGGNPAVLPATFLWKLGFVVAATIGVIVIDYTPWRRRPPVVAIGGLVADAAIVAAVLLAVLTFN